MNKSLAKILYYSLIPLWLIISLCYDLLYHIEQEVKK